MTMKHQESRSQAIPEHVLEILRDTTSTADVATNLDLPLYDSGLLDSLGTVTLMIAFGDAFGLDISPAEFDREAWATPRKIIVDIERRIGQKSSR